MNKKMFWVTPLFLAGLLLVHFPVPAQPFYFDWARGFGGSGGYGLVQGNQLVTDKDGNAYVIGMYNCDSADFDPGVGTAYLFPAMGGGHMSEETFICKLDAAGNYIWAKGIEGTARGMDIAIDTAGNVYATGHFSATVDFDPGPGTADLTASGGEDVFVCKFDNAGNYIWALNLGGVGTDNSRGIAVDDSGNVYVTGFFNGTADFDPGTGTANLTANGDHDAFVCKLSSVGNYIWAKSWGGSGWDLGTSVSVDGAGNVYTTGVFWYTVDFDPGPGTANLSAVTYATFVSRLDAAGNYVWAKTMSGSPNAGYDLVTGNTGIFITGTFEGTVDFDPGTNTANRTSNNGSYDIFVCKLDTAGNYLWAQSVGGINTDWGNAITIDAVDNVYVMARFSDIVDFDPGPGAAYITSSGDDDIAVLKLDASGNYLWSGSMGSPAIDMTGGIAVSSGNIYSMGTFKYNPIDADPTSGVFMIAPASVGQYPADIFVSKVLCGDTFSLVLTIDTCGDFTFGGKTYTVSGTYVQALSGVLGCDSTITLHLTITQIEYPVITVSEFLLGTTEHYDSYQWLLNDEIIQGATDSTYAVVANGNYRVVVRKGNCRDTSAAYEVNNVGISSINDIEQQITVYPNPANDIVYIQSPVSVNVALAGMEGKIIRKVSDAKHLSIGGLAEGIYFLQITNDRGNLIKVEKIIRQEQ